MILADSVVDLFTETNWFVNVNSLVMVVVFIVQNVAATWVTNKLNIKNIEVGEVDTKVTDVQGNVRVLSGVMYELTKATQKIGEMGATAYMNSNLDAKAKMEITRQWVEIEKIFQAVTIMLADYVDDLTDEAIEKVKTKNELLGQALDIAKDAGGDILKDVFTNAPSYLEQLINNKK